MNGFHKIGNFGVDSGTVMIVDPCYVLDRSHGMENLSVENNKYPQSFGKNWSDFITTQLTDKVGNVKNTAQITNGMAVVSSTGYGDGSYDVWAREDDDGRVVELRIFFENMTFDDIDEIEDEYDENDDEEINDY